MTGALAAGKDLDGWPRNDTIDVAEAACLANASCVGLTYHSSDLHPPKTTVLKLYLKFGAGSTGDTSWSRHMKGHAGCFTGILDTSCANATGWRSAALKPRPEGPCDILGAAQTPCVAAHSVGRALYANYTGPLSVTRSTPHIPGASMHPSRRYVVTGTACCATRTRPASTSACTAAAVSRARRTRTSSARARRASSSASTTSRRKASIAQKHRSIAELHRIA